MIINFDSLSNVTIHLIRKSDNKIFRSVDFNCLRHPYIFGDHFGRPQGGFGNLSFDRLVELFKNQCRMSWEFFIQNTLDEQTRENIESLKKVDLNNITEDDIKLWIDTDARVNEEFLRFSFIGDRKNLEVLFRIESYDTIWNDQINSILTDNYSNIQTITMSDYRIMSNQGKYDDVYKINDKAIYKIAKEDFETILKYHDIK